MSRARDTANQINRVNSSAADATAITVDSGERIGIGETSPNADLVVKQSGSTFTPSSQTVALFQRNTATGSGAKVCILSGNNTSGDLNFGDAEDEDIGRLRYEHNNNAMTFTTNGAERMRIDASGYVTKPNHPAFQAFAMGTNHSNAGGYIPFTHTILNQGNHFSTANDRFIAPVDGVYHFHFHSFIDQLNTTTGQIAFYKNGSWSWGGYEIRNYLTHRSTGYGPVMVVTATVGLAANDYVQVYTTVNLHANAGNYFGGHLIG